MAINRQTPVSHWRVGARLGVGALAACAIVSLAYPLAAQPARIAPVPIADEAGNSSASEMAVIAGGCFWGVQGVFQHVKGVETAVSGYAGGASSTAHYEIVSGGETGHAEAVSITFNPREISYGRILQIYFSVAHDPTEINRQGPDVGTQYRSAIFPASAEQGRVAKAYIDQLNKSGAFSAPLATTVEPLKGFYRAEKYHQDFLALNPTYPYIEVNDLPKVEDLKKLFPDLYRGSPVLVGSSSS
jgi:peptide-methionine (S)-S-oxide reductase